MADLDDLPPPRTEPLATFSSPTTRSGPPPPPPVPPGRLGPLPLAHASRTWTIVAIAGVALAAAAGGAVWRPRSGDVDRASATVRALVGAGVGAVIAAAILLAFRRRRFALPAAIVTAITALLIALGAILGSATAPTDESSGEREEPQQQPTRPQDVPFSKRAMASFVDADGDGEPDRDQNGELIVVLDADGDGRFERRLVRCPESDDRPSDASGSPSVRLDLGCDGDVDGTIPISPTMLSELPPPMVTGEGQLVPIDPGDVDGGASGSGSAGGGGGGGSDDESDDSKPGSGIGNALKPILWTLLVLAGLGVVAYAVSRLVRRRDKEPAWPTGETTESSAETSKEVDAAAVDAAIEDSIETLLGHPDPRLAIRAAYAVLLDALAECGFGRRSFEAPEEHLTRCLTGLSVEPAPMRALLRLFAVARFSTHEVTEDDRAAAVAALRRSQELLRRRAADLAAAAAVQGGQG